ncbi:ankyrin repeat-containing domain protein [Usnea florida]
MPDGTWKREGPPIMMVPLDSARQWYPREVFVACNADHSQIAKLKRGENSIYPRVRWAIKKALLNAGGLYSEVERTYDSFPQHLRGVDESSTMRQKLLKASHGQVSLPSNERLSEVAPLPSRPRSENAINQQVKSFHQMKANQSTHHDDVQSNSKPLDKTSYQSQSTIEHHKSDDTQSSLIPTDHARMDLTSIMLDDSLGTSKSTESATSSVAPAEIRQKPEGDLKPDSAKIESADFGLSSFQPEAPESATDGAKSMVFDENFQSVIAAGDEDKTREFLARRYDVNCKGDDGTTPLLLAARHRHEIIVKMLLEQGANPGARDNGGQTTLHKLTEVQRIPIPETLIDLLLRDRPPLEISNSLGNTPLMKACALGEDLLATKLINHGANVGATNLRRPAHLHSVALYDSANVDSCLLAYGKCEHDTTPLHYAIRGKSADIIDKLLLAGANREATIAPLKLTPLMVAVQENGLATVVRLLKFGVNINASNWAGMTSLHLAVEKGHFGIVKALLDHGANPDACDNWKFSCLHVAAKGGHLEIVKALLDHGANLDACDNRYSSCLHYAAKGGHFEIVKALLDHGANPDACDNRHSSCLHDAAKGGHLEVIKALLDRGANPTIRDSSISLFGDKPSAVLMKDDVPPTQKEAVRALLRDAEKAWKRSGKK